ncbi:T9SS type A sorting domain-containing protein [Psychroflexus sp. YR1-1]|uniref:T9SS type A sorting domain-containing protein n=1 Tax=Psychroflexus aurantiacus TaxID=2709310 RepID=A0A6B3QZ84_9FLAO|nr:T9SS type A sorting domain-containing protein [Psychroflexus aurantiacus]NEV93048.1 T9SS type A sorting domain-containing protein [Psychroflexus aurantiacus]
MIFIKTFFTFSLFCVFVSMQGQFFVSDGTQVSIKGQTNLYADIELVNKGEIIFDPVATGGLYIDAGLDNSTGNLTLNDAILHLGSNTTRADGDQNLIFGDNDTIKFVELAKNSGTYTVTGGLLNITNTFTSNSGTLEAGDKIVLKSTSIQNTALVPESNAGVVNNIRVERFIPAKRGWRMMASPVATEESILKNWQQNGLNPGETGYRPNVGTHITGGTEINGFDQSGTNFPSMYTFNVSNQQWAAIDNTNALKLLNFEPYLILIRGDRSINLQINDTAETETTLEQTGALHIGMKSNTFNAPSNGSFIAIANPYQAPVDMNQVIGASNIYFKNQLWIWIQTDFTSGQYVNISNLADPQPSVTGSNVTEDIQPGQSVFIQTQDDVSGDVSITFNEANKVGQGSLTETFSVETNAASTPDGFLRIGLYNVDSTPFTDVAYDGVIVRFDNQYNNYVDDYDGMKLFNAEESLAITLEDTFLSVNNRKTPSQLDEVINLSVFNLAEDEYVFSIELEGLSSLPDGIMLWDKYLDNYTTLNDQDLINFSVDALVPESIAEDRFALVFENSTLSIEDQFSSNINVYPNPVINDYLTIQFSEGIQNTKTEVEIFSINGVLLKKETYENTGKTLKLTNLNFSSGVYILKIKQGNITNTFKIVKK